MICFFTIFHFIIHAIYHSSFYLSRIPGGQLQPIVFSLSCSLRSLAQNLAYITNNYSVVYTFIMICIFLFYKKGDFYYYCNRNHLNLLVRVLNL
ncbi:hypothetical protein BUZ08_06850 [Staphylococcus gallinarum]|nr:hypothetical protein BUZ08_06850 [Staphylococcus gallinarum]RIO78923.1 hypothetical protein BUZ07_08680 [Staphylococcus gallinarum]